MPNLTAKLINASDVRITERGGKLTITVDEEGRFERFELDTANLPKLNPDAVRGFLASLGVTLAF